MTNRELQWCDHLAISCGWPLAVAETAFEVFGASLFNQQSRTFRSLNRRVTHALLVWEEKYGPFTEAQEIYAGKLLAWAVKRGAEEAGPDSRNIRLYPYVLNLLAQLVNHEKVDSGFRRRLAPAEEGLILPSVFKAVPR